MFLTGVLCTVCGAQVYWDFVAAGGILFHKHMYFLPVFLIFKLDLLSKTLSLAKVNLLEEIGLSYVVLVTRPYKWYNKSLPIDLEVWPTFRELYSWL